MFDGLTPDLMPRIFLAIGGVGVAFVVLVLVLIFLKRRNSPLFIKGGKSREPRLMVLDAAAIDPKRRLVLIRRDDVEHLIMIGGPSDIVIETGIAERGIADRAKPAQAVSRVATAEEPVADRTAVTAPAPEHRPVAPAPERRIEQPVRQAAAEPEKPATAPEEMRPVQPAAQPAIRTAAVQAGVAARTTPAAERLVERPQIEREPSERRIEAKSVSAAGPMLYGQESTPANRTAPDTSPARTQQIPSQPQPLAPAERPVASVARAAEAALDAARPHVLPNPQPAVGGLTVATSDSERLLAARLDAARAESMRRVQSAQPAGQTTGQMTGQMTAQAFVDPAAGKRETAADPAMARDAEPSDFERLLEAELDANGVFGSQAPQVRGESRITNAAAADGVVPPVRVTPPITGATPDVTSEEEVARLLGEIAVNRKP